MIITLYNSIIKFVIKAVKSLNMEITVKEAAKKLGLHPSRIRQLITEGKLPAARQGKRLLLIRESDLKLIKPTSHYSRAGKVSNKTVDDLVGLINKQNLKIESLEKDLLALKEKIFSLEPTSKLSQQPNLLKKKENPPQPLSGSEENISKEKSISNKRLEFLKANQKLYAGKYLAFDQEKLLFVASTYKEARESAVKAGILKPFVVHVPDPEIVYFVNW